MKLQRRHYRFMAWASVLTGLLLSITPAHGQTVSEDPCAANSTELRERADCFALIRRYQDVSGLIPLVDPAWLEQMVEEYELRWEYFQEAIDADISAGEANEMILSVVETGNPRVDSLMLDIQKRVFGYKEAGAQSPDFLAPVLRWLYLPDAPDNVLIETDEMRLSGRTDSTATLHLTETFEFPVIDRTLTRRSVFQWQKIDGQWYVLPGSR